MIRWTTWSCYTRTVTVRDTAVEWERSVAFREGRLQRLELRAGKLARAVLRGLESRETLQLPDPHRLVARFREVFVMRTYLFTLMVLLWSASPGHTGPV